jgi:Protein of unknown function (DUF3800)
VHIVYIDDSRDEDLCVCSALAIPAEQWRAAFQGIREFRRDLKKRDGIYVYKELHAWKLVSGRGRIADRVVPKGRRCQIFKDALKLITDLPGAQVFNACFGSKDDEVAYERLLNRINRTMQAWDSHAVLIWDEGKEAQHRRLTRKMGVHNPIPSRYGRWAETGTFTKNIPLEFVIEDPVFKPSEQSYFIQLADFVAYALLRREHPIPSRSKYGLHQAFDVLAPVLVTAASTTDPEGIIRPTAKRPGEPGR